MAQGSSSHEIDLVCQEYFAISTRSVNTLRLENTHDNCQFASNTWYSNVFPWKNSYCIFILFYRSLFPKVWLTSDKETYIIDSGIDLGLNRWQAITSIHNDQGHWCRYTSPGLSEMIWNLQIISRIFSWWITSQIVYDNIVWGFIKLSQI